MALSDEQRALLQLLLEGGQGYGDIGSLLGIGPDEVRSRAREALREIGGADPDAEVQLSDYLLGQADPIGRADAVRHLQGDPAANELASRLLAQLRLIAPRADLPEIPAPRGGRAAKAPSSGAATPAAPEASAPDGPSGAPSRIRRVASSKRQSQLLVGLGALALLIVVGVLAIAGVFGGDDDGGGDEAGATTAATTTPSGADAGNSAVVRLSPVDGASGATGQAALVATEEQPVMELNLSGLEPTSGEDIYVVWLYANEQAAFPIARDRVTDSGSLSGATPLGAEVIALLAQFGCVDVSLASARETERAIRQAVEGGSLPPHTGETVLRGEIPTVPGQEAPTGADSNCDIARAQGGQQGQGGQGQGEGGQGGAQSQGGG